MLKVVPIGSMRILKVVSLSSSVRRSTSSAMRVRWGVVVCLLGETGLNGDELPYEVDELVELIGGYSDTGGGFFLKAPVLDLPEVLLLHEGRLYFSPLSRVPGR